MAEKDSEQEIEKRFKDVLRRVARTPPKPRKKQKQGEKDELPLIY
jgi:hypothetical protein